MRSRYLFILFLFPFFIFGTLRFEEPWGKDATICTRQNITSQKKLTPSTAAKVAKSVISFHQNFISPASGPRSSFRPTSSKYMELAIKRYGFIKGYLMGCDRLLRENNEAWVYPSIEINGVVYKFDPAIDQKNSPIR
ncbi:MAG TPA: membrane protein insertion efficiency factor YidD [Chlamydiales bacterium]|nr:membrane protein insertion efficiency factor YidD [Chlamydiales bacterium]